MADVNVILSDVLCFVSTNVKRFDKSTHHRLFAGSILYTRKYLDHIQSHTVIIIIY